MNRMSIQQSLKIIRKSGHTFDVMFYRNLIGIDIYSMVEGPVFEATTWRAVLAKTAQYIKNNYRESKNS